MPVMPGTFGKFSGASFPECPPELFLAKRCAQRFYICVSPEVHHLRNNAMPIPKGYLRRLPPDVFAREGRQVHGGNLTWSG